MIVVYSIWANAQKENFMSEHPRGHDIVRAIENDLAHDPITRATRIGSDRFAQVYTPEIYPPVEVRVSYLAGDKIMLKYFSWKML